MTDVFISYARKDEGWASRIKADLERAGYGCWLDTTDILGGDLWVWSISQGIESAGACISLVSRHANHSKWVLRELSFATERGKRVIPLLLEDCGLPIALVDRQAIPLHRDYQRGLEQLRAALDRTGPAKAPAPQDPQRARELAYLTKLQFEQLLHIELYTPLAGVARVHERQAEPLETPVMRQELELLARFDRREVEQAEPRRFDDVIDAVQQAPRVALLGEPGAGKTTALWRLAADAVGTARADPSASIPLVVPLGRWTKPEQPLPEFIRQQLGELSQHLDRLLEGKRALLLLDGLNEMPTAERAAKVGQVRSLLDDHPELGVVVTCRELDYTGELRLHLDTLTIQPLDPPRILDFVTRYLQAWDPEGGRAHGDALFWRLAGGETVREVWEAWQAAGASLTQFFKAEEIPKENPNVYWQTTVGQDAIWRTVVRDPRSLMRLARNPYLLLMLTRIYQTTGELPANRAALFEGFVDILLVREGLASGDRHQVKPTPEGEALLAALGRLAWTLQTRRGVEEDENVLTALDRAAAERIMDSRQLHQAASASVLAVGSDEVRFTHQLLQEYFTARGLRELLDRGELDGAALWPAPRWWERSGWEEAAVLLAGLCQRDCTPVLDCLADANPEVAAQCILRSGAETPERTLERLRGLWLPRMTDLASDPHPAARAAVGRALGSVRLHGRPLDNRPGVGLDESGLPDIAWVEIPAGPFIYQEGQTLELPAFAIARYPVTNAQFQAFIDDGGYENDTWWQGLAERIEVPWEPRWPYANHPRERVSWYEAVAFCHWLRARLGYEVRLPGEQEWEKAARGADGREYPWGREWREGHANTGEARLGQTTAVGLFPQGASPYEVLDLAGNVWEWCLNEYEAPSEVSLEGSAPRVLRGGSWLYSRGGARAAVRDVLNPGRRLDDFGFRVSRSSPI